MNRLILTIMFAIALALSFVSLARNDMSWNSNSQNSSASDSGNGSWVSRMAHLFGSYKPVMGKLSMASEDLTPCSGANCQAIPDDTMKIVGYARTSADNNHKGMTLVDFEFKCEKCDKVLKYEASVPKNQTDLSDVTKKALEQFKKDTADQTVAKADVKVDPIKEKQAKRKEETQKRDAQRKVDTCKATDVEKNDDGKWVATGKVAAEDMDDCLRDNYDRLSTSTDKHNKATAKALEKNILTRYLNRKPGEDFRNDEWDDFIAKHSTDEDNFGIYMTYRESAQEVANFSGFAAGVKDLKNKNYTAAYQDFENFRQVKDDPNASAEFNAALTKLREARKDYADTVPDGYKPDATDFQIASLANANLATNPGTISDSTLNTLENLAKKQAVAQGGGNDLATILAGNNSASLSAQNAISSLTLNGYSASDIRGVADRGDSFGALASLTATGDRTDLGSTSASLSGIGTNSVARGLSTGLPTSGSTMANLRLGRNS